MRPLALTILITCLASCGAKVTTLPGADPLASATTRTDHLGETLGKTDADLRTAADGIANAANAGLAATPADLAAVRAAWGRVIALVGTIRSSVQQLTALQVDVGEIKADVAAGVEREHALVGQVAKLTKDNEKLSAIMPAVKAAVWLGIILAGIGVTLGFVFKWYNLSVGAAAGGLAVVVLGTLAAKVMAMPWWWWIIPAAIVGVGVLWLIGESIWRGSFWKALKTPIWVDIQDIVRDARATRTTRART